MKTVNDIASSALLGPRNKEGSEILVPRRKTQRETDDIADYLAHKLGAPEYRPAFLKLAWRLDRGTLQRLCAETLERRPTNPRAYFIASARNELRKGVV